MIRSRAQRKTKTDMLLGYIIYKHLDLSFTTNENSKLYIHPLLEPLRKI